MSNLAEVGTTIMSPNGTAGGNYVSPGQGTRLPYGVVIPHTLPTPENFKLPSSALPSFDGTPIVSSIIHRAPPASDGGHHRAIQTPTLPAFTQDIGKPLWSVPKGLRELPRGLRGRAAAALPEGMTRRLARFNNASQLARADRADNSITKSR